MKLADMMPYDQVFSVLSIRLFSTVENPTHTEYTFGVIRRLSDNVVRIYVLNQNSQPYIYYVYETNYMQRSIHLDTLSHTHFITVHTCLHAII